jgi:phosphate:Na+ symporter
MDVGTTATAMLATVGGNVNARRTGTAHIVFNLFSGLLAFLLIPSFVQSWNAFAPAAMRNDPEIGLVSFHSLFNIVGVVCVLPFAKSFARFIVWLVPAGNRVLERRLEPMLLSNPRVALESVHATLDEMIKLAFSELASLLESRKSVPVFTARVKGIEEATTKLSDYMNRVHIYETDPIAGQRQIALLHVLDHLTRFLARAGKLARLQTVIRDDALLDWKKRIAFILAATDHHDFSMEVAKKIENVWIELDQQIEPFRQKWIEETIREGCSLEETLDRLDGIRWLRRIAYHAWRMTYHMARATETRLAVPPPTSMRQELEPNDE